MATYGKNGKNGRNGKNGSASAARRGRRKNQRARARSGMPRWASALLVVGILGFAGMMVAMVAAYMYYQSYADELVAPDELAINQPSFGAKIYDRFGVLLYEYVDDRQGLRRPVKLENVSEAFLAATISTEDDNFFTNPGINLKGLARAAWENSPFSGTAEVFGGSGGSSITQQLVKNVYIPAEERVERSVDRKIKEVVYAIELTNRYSKDQILEWYVNQISYAGVYNGVEAASQGYFGKPARELTLAEAALLAGIPQSPAEYDPVNRPESAQARRDEILDLMKRQGRIQIGEDKYFELNDEQLVAAKAEPINIARKSFPIEAPHFVLQYIEPQLRTLFGCSPSSTVKCEPLLRDGLIVTTTLDLSMQKVANDILEGYILQFEASSNSHNGSTVIIDPKTGEIIVMVGSRDYFREDIEGKNNNATALNSPGSAFKPFVYMTSFMELGWGPGTLIVDAPLSIPQSDGSNFVPSNPNNSYQGPITLRNALGNSLNIPAIKVAQATGVDKVVQWGKKLGFTTLTGNYGPAIATGGVDITAVDMAYGYSVLANGGVMRGQTPLVKHRAGERNLDPISILKIEDAQKRVRFDVNQRRGEERIVPEEFPYLIASITTDGSSQCLVFGCNGILVRGGQVGVKTGTSEPFDPNGPNAKKIGDTWAFGFSPDVVVGIWAGNSDNEPIVNLFSTSISFRTMRDTVQAWYDGGRPSTSFRRPEKVVEETVCVPSGLKPTPLCGRTTKDLFAKDKVPTQDDTWWQRVRVDGRTGLLAGPTTPPQFVQEQVMLVFPPELLATEDDKKRAQEWANALGLPLAPTEISPATGGGSSEAPNVDLPAVIFSPIAGQALNGVVQVTGRASSAQFLSYRLEYGQGASPANWIALGQSGTRTEGGTLGAWDTTGLAPGPYTLRLVVQDRVRGESVASVTVTVGLPVLATPTPTP